MSPEHTVRQRDAVTIEIEGDGLSRRFSRPRAVLETAVPEGDPAAVRKHSVGTEGIKGSSVRMDHAGAVTALKRSAADLLSVFMKMILAHFFIFPPLMICTRAARKSRKRVVNIMVLEKQICNGKNRHLYTERAEKHPCF